MITITPQAAEQIRASAIQTHAQGLPLRLAAKRNADGSIHYGMGFDDRGGDEDLNFSSQQITIVVAPSSLALLSGTVIDFVELDSGDYQFVFKNPNDPNFAPTSL